MNGVKRVRGTSDPLCFAVLTSAEVQHAYNARQAIISTGDQLMMMLLPQSVCLYIYIYIYIARQRKRIIHNFLHSQAANDVCAKDTFVSLLCN